MKIIIAGGRDFNNYYRLENEVNYIIKNMKLTNEEDNNITILSGNARGTDKLGELYAKKQGFKLEIYPANWDKYGKSAGIIRNKEMANNADILIAFWDQKSKGTENIINEMNNKIVNIIYY